MFCVLHGATRTPCRRNHAHNAVATHVLPTLDPVPRTLRAFIMVGVCFR
jgi:hypothetical protein